MAYKNPEDQAAAAKRHYAANKDKMKARAQAYTAAHRERLRKFLIGVKGAPCTDCGVSYPTPVMEFDHVRGAKVANIADMISRSSSLERLKAEVAKCDLVCANCHRLRHCTL